MLRFHRSQVIHRFHYFQQLFTVMSYEERHSLQWSRESDDLESICNPRLQLVLQTYTSGKALISLPPSEDSNFFLNEKNHRHYSTRTSWQFFLELYYFRTNLFVAERIYRESYNRNFIFFLSFFFTSNTYSEKHALVASAHVFSRAMHCTQQTLW